MVTEKSKVAGVADALKKAKAKGKPKAAKKRRPKAKATSNKKAKAQEKRTPTSGQSGPPIELSVEGLNTKEAKIFSALNGSGSGVRTIMTITELATECFKSRGKKQANSWTRNSLRRLVQSGLVEKVERGKYRVSDAGRKKLARAA